MNTPNDFLTPIQLADAIDAEVAHIRSSDGTDFQQSAQEDACTALTLLSAGVRNLSVRMTPVIEIEEEREARAKIADKKAMAWTTQTQAGIVSEDIAEIIRARTPVPQEGQSPSRTV